MFSYRKQYTQLTTKLDRLTSTYQEYSLIKKKLLKTLNNLSRQSFQGVTYLLPFLCITSLGMNGDFMYLLISGIKKNAEEKTSSSELMDDLENKLWTLEKELNECVDSNLHIKNNEIEKFWRLLNAYIDVLYYDHNFSFSTSPIYNHNFCTICIAVSFINYMVYCSTGLETKENEKIAMEFQELICKKILKKLLSLLLLKNGF